MYNPYLSSMKKTQSLTGGITITQSSSGGIIIIILLLIITIVIYLLGYIENTLPHGLRKIKELDNSTRCGEIGKLLPYAPWNETFNSLFNILIGLELSKAPEYQSLVDAYHKKCPESKVVRKDHGKEYKKNIDYNLVQTYIGMKKKFT